MSTYFETPEEAATGLKMDIDAFIEEWLERHDIYDTDKTQVIISAVRRAGWPFFHDELLQYLENSLNCEIDDDEGVTVLDDEEEAEEAWMPVD